MDRLKPQDALPNAADSVRPGVADRLRNALASGDLRLRALACLAAVLVQAPLVADVKAAGTDAFVETVESVRGMDPTVRNVQARVLSRSGVQTGCDAAPEGELVAFYCPKDRTVYVLRRSLDLVESEFGVAGVRYLAAHELAHGRQHALTGFSQAIVRTAVLDELQADCVAGAYLQQGYGYSVASEAGQQVRRFAYVVGDRAFFHQDWHGNPRLRVAALSRGLNQGDPSRCLSSSRFNYGNLVQQGLSWLERMQQRRQP